MGRVTAVQPISATSLGFAQGLKPALKRSYYLGQVNWRLRVACRSSTSPVAGGSYPLDYRHSRQSGPIGVQKVSVDYVRYRTENFGLLLHHHIVWWL